MKEKRRDREIALLLFGIGVLLRVLYFGRIPGGVNQDEAMGAVDALAMARYGTDRFGTPFPVHLKAWGYGQMSAGLCYLQAICIKLFGFSAVTIRLPMLLFSILSMGVMYLLGKEISGERLGRILLALTVICPWHFLQSRWAMDCNLFPHMFLLGFYLLLTGLEKTKRLYGSMVCFGLCFYCYGIAVYTVPFFLLGYGLYLVKKHKITSKKLLLCALIFVVVALPEILVMLINFFHWETLYTPLFTMQYFEESVRGNDILFLHFSFSQLWENAKTLFLVAFLQAPGAAFNAPPQFGPLYHISSIFCLIGLTALFRALFQKEEKQEYPAAVLGFFLMAVFAGLITRDVNVNRINIIFPVMLILTGMGIFQMTRQSRFRSILGAGIGMAYLFLFVWFLRYYFWIFQSKVGEPVYHMSYVEAMRKINEREDGERLYLTCFTGTDANQNISEILLQYACELDAEYVQGRKDMTNGKAVLPYPQRYVFFYSWEVCEEELIAGLEKEKILFLVHEDELELLELEYEVAGQCGGFYFLKPL